MAAFVRVRDGKSEQEKAKRDECICKGLLTGSFLVIWRVAAPTLEGARARCGRVCGARAEDQWERPAFTLDISTHPPALLFNFVLFAGLTKQLTM